MPQSNPHSDLDTYSRLRQAIDNSQLDEIMAIFHAHPDLNWNAITPNGLSALWWALTPPPDKTINKDLVDLLLELERNNRRVIDPAQMYAGLRPDYYLHSFGLPSAFYEIRDHIQQAQITFADQQRIERTENTVNQTQQLAQDAHGASNPFVVHASDENMKRLFKKYGAQLNVRKELKEIESFITTPVFKQLFPMVREQQDQIRSALSRIKTDTAARSDMPPDQGPCMLKAALALTWLAAKETNPQHLSEGAATDPLDRQKAVLVAMQEAQSAYGLNKPSCWLGTWGRIGNSLCGSHKDVFYHQDTFLTGELARDIAITFTGNELDTIYKNTRSIYWAILRDTLGSTKNDSDTSTYLNELLDKMLEKVKVALHCANVEISCVNKLIEEMKEFLPLSHHELSRQFILLQGYFYTAKQSDVFNKHLVNLKEEDINDVLSSLKAAYLPYMKIPADLSIQEKTVIESLKKEVLDIRLARRSSEDETSLTSQNEDDERTEDDRFWDIFRVQRKINEFNNSNLSNWYQSLELEKKLLFTKIYRQALITDKGIIEFALKHACLTGLSLRGMDLSGADFRGWDLRGIDFSETNLRKADLRLMTAAGAKWERCDLAQAHFNQCLFPEALLGSAHCTPKVLAVKHSNGHTTLHEAIQVDNFDTVQAILASKHCTPEVLATKDKFGETALRYAIVIDNLDTVQAILASKHCTPEVLATKDNFGDTDLHWAIKSNRMNIAQALLTSTHCTPGLFVIKNYDGFTAMDLARRKKRYDSNFSKIEKDIRKKIAKGKEDFITNKLNTLLENKNRADILALFKEIKNPYGKYNYLHLQRNPKWDRLRLFFKSNRNTGEKNFWHTATYQKAVKLLKKAYLDREEDTSIKQADEKELIDYFRGNSPVHFKHTTTRRRKL